MSRQEFAGSKSLTEQGWSDQTLVFALLRRANDKQANVIAKAYPEWVAEFKERSDNPGGFLPDELEKRANAETGHSR